MHEEIEVGLTEAALGRRRDSRASLFPPKIHFSPLRQPDDGRGGVKARIKDCMQQAEMMTATQQTRPRQLRTGERSKDRPRTERGILYRRAGQARADITSLTGLPEPCPHSILELLAVVVDVLRVPLGHGHQRGADSSASQEEVAPVDTFEEAACSKAGCGCRVGDARLR